MILQAHFSGAVVEYRSQFQPYARVLDSIELYGKSRPTYTEDEKGKPRVKTILGLPDVWRINPVVTAGKPQGVQMTAEFQHWIYRINCEWMRGARFANDTEYRVFWLNELREFKQKIGGQTIKDFNSLFRSKASHVNFAGVDIYENAITGANKGAGWPIYSNIVTGRWVGLLKAEGSNQFHVINASRPFTHFNPWEHPHLFDEPLNTGREFVGDTNILKRDDLRKSYDDFGGRVVLPVMLPADSFGVFPDARFMYPSDAGALNKF